VDPQHAATALDVGDEVGVVEAAVQQRSSRAKTLVNNGLLRAALSRRIRVV
jgi:hypothetical protein